MKKTFFTLCLCSLFLTSFLSATARSVDISSPGTAVGIYVGGEYGDGYWLQLKNGDKILSFFSPDMEIKGLKGQDGKTVQFAYTYTLFERGTPGSDDYSPTKVVNNFTILPDITPQELQTLKASLLKAQEPKQALLDIGAYYQYGLRGIPVDEKKALEWYKNLGKLGIGEALTKAGDIHLNKKSPLYDAGLSYGLYRQAAEAGHTQAITRLGDYFFEHDTYDANPQEIAITLYTNAAKQKDLDAQQRLIALNLKAITSDFILPQVPCERKRLGEAVITGVYIRNTSHEGYYGFLVHGDDKKAYDIGIGNDIEPAFDGIKPGDSITIPFYSEQSFDTLTGLCSVEHHHNTKSSTKGSFSRK